MKIKKARIMPYNNKFKQWPSVWILIGFMVLVAAFGRSWGVIEEKSKQMDYFKQKFEEKDKRVEDVLKENAELREKLENSSKVQVPEATKNVVRFYLQKYFGDKADEAEKIVQCESGFSNLILNKNNNGTVDRGIFQLNSVHANRFAKMYGIDYETGAHDFELNVKYAKFLYDNQGWQPWVCAKIVKL